MSTKMNLIKKEAVAQAILETYKVAREINRAVGCELHDDYKDHALNLVLSEYKEGKKALAEGDLIEVVDSICDQLVTGAELLMIEDGNTDLLLDTPKYFNLYLTIEELFPLAGAELEKYSSDKGKAIDYLGLVEDMAMVVNADMVACLKSVNLSNLSKFVKVGECENPDLECDRIEDLGRYENVYYEEIELFGEKHYVFKSTYDKSTDEHFVKGKYLKAFTFFEPELIVYG